MKVRSTFTDLKHGKDAITHYQVLKHLGLGATVVACTLETGRTHQLRVERAAHRTQQRRAARERRRTAAEGLGRPATVGVVVRDRDEGEVVHAGRLELVHEVV